ncbi:MAG: hypothetical protein PHP65_06590, partial [Bacilli bacterium]|nr:hypothetical protein [Bacilli bacterium]
MKKLLRFSLLLFIFVALFVTNVSAAAADITMVVTNPGANASTEMNVSWHTTFSPTTIQYTKATDVSFATPTTKLGVCNAVPFDGKTTQQCRASLTNLEAV